MKKLLLLAFLATCISVIIPCKVYAVDITVGATTWYVWWDVEQEEETLNLDPVFMYGPALAVKFNNDFNLTFVYLYGKFHYEESGAPKSEIKRYDSDLALNYKLNDYFKVFAGIKYMGFLLTNAYEETDSDAYGPGLGLSCTYPIVNNLYALAYLSGFYLWGKEDDVSDNVKHKDYGINSSLSIAYYIAPASTVVSLGGRYQYFKMKYDNSHRDNNKFYGVTLTATYTFGI